MKLYFSTNGGWRVLSPMTGKQKRHFGPIYSSYNKTWMDDLIILNKIPAWATFLAIFTPCAIHARIQKCFREIYKFFVWFDIFPQKTQQIEEFFFDLILGLNIRILAKYKRQTKHQPNINQNFPKGPSSKIETIFHIHKLHKQSGNWWTSIIEYPFTFSIHIRKIFN